MIRFVLYAFSGLCVAAALLLFFIPKTVENEPEEEPKSPFVAISEEQMEQFQTSKAAPGTIQKQVSAPARILLNPDKVMHLVPKLSGIVLEAHKWVGDPVVKGEILAVFESGDMAIAKSKYLDASKKSGSPLQMRHGKSSFMRSKFLLHRITRRPFPSRRRPTLNLSWLGSTCWVLV